MKLKMLSYCELELLAKRHRKTFEKSNEKQFKLLANSDRLLVQILVKSNEQMVEIFASD